MAEPELLAKFELEDDGAPAYTRGNKLKHYTIQLFLRDAPKDASIVTYKLHPTYLDPVRKVPRDVPEFNEYITSYGDFDVRATVEANAGKLKLQALLSDALRRYYSKGKASSAIQSAIAEIEQH